MGWHVGTDLAEHRALVEGFLAADPVGVTGLATILANLALGVSWSEQPPVFAVHRDETGAVDGAALRTPPHPLHLDGAADPAGLVAALGAGVPGVNAPEPVARAFAAAWAAAHGVGSEVVRRLHVLALPGPGALVAPPGEPGARPATPADDDRLVDLATAMRTEIGEAGPLIRRLVTDRVRAGLTWVVDGGDGVPVATSSASPPAAGVSRIGGVYTVPAARGRGYAAAATAAVSRAAYAAGAAHVCLFTDAANPTSNGVYERLGFVRRPEDRLVLGFPARLTPGPG